MKFTVIICSYRRVSSLNECLKGLDRLVVQPIEVIVVYREQDEESAAFLSDDWMTKKSTYAKKAVSVTSPGVTRAIRQGLKQARGEIIALIDDDAVPHPDWLQKMLTHYLDPQVAGVGGRDLIPSLSETSPAETVGTITWYGKVVGNHHIGTAHAMFVDVLKGVNMSIKKDVLVIPDFLSGQGAEAHWEVFVCLNVRRLGYKLIYDPTILVDHFPGTRFDYDKRDTFVPRAILDASYNINSVLLALLPWPQKLLRYMYGVFVGDRSGPGMLRTMIAVVRFENTVIKSYIPAQIGLFGATVYGAHRCKRNGRTKSLA